ncbi:MAG TPA: tyrosine-protein phosphatase [Stenomitos sp.]
MNERFKWWIRLPGLGALLFLVGCSAQGPLTMPPPGPAARHVAQGDQRAAVPIRRFGRVQDPRHPERRIYRGGQPSDDGLRRLAELGVKVLVSLQDVNDQGEEASDVAHEREMAAELGMTFRNFPITMDGVPSAEAVQGFLAAAREADRQPVFIHCEWGRDRTGALIAVYRLQEDGYSVEQSLAEMESYGYEAARYPVLEDFLRAYAASLAPPTREEGPSAA